MAEQLTALLQWQDSDVIHLVNLVDGVETRHSHLWQESLNRIVPLQGGHGAEHIFLSDDGIARRGNFDGRDDEVVYPAVSFRVYGYREFEGVDLAIIAGYDDVLQKERVAYFRPSTGYLIREKDAVVQSPTYGVPVYHIDALRQNEGTYFAGKIVTVMGPHGGAAKLHLYDPYTDAEEAVLLSGSTGDFSHAGTYLLKQWNNRLCVIPRAARHSVVAAPTKNYFEVDAGWNATGWMFSDFAVLNDPQFAGRTMLAALGAHESDSHVIYSDGFDRLSGGVALVFNLATRQLTKVTQGVVPDADLPVALAQIDTDATLGAFATMGSKGVTWVGNYVRTDGAVRVGPRLLVWDMLTGELESVLEYTLDSNSDASQSHLQLFQIQPYELSGSVRVKTIPVATRVDMQDERSGRFLGSVQSNEDGYYTFRCYTNHPKTTIATHPRTGVRNGATVVIPTQK